MLVEGNLRLIAVLGIGGAWGLFTGMVVGAGIVLLLAPQAWKEAVQSLRSLFPGQW